MNPIIKASNKVVDFALSRIKSNKIFAEYYKRSTRSAAWNRQATDYKSKQIKDWTVAVMTATDPENPRRGDLMRFYQSLMLDLHLMSCIDNRTLPVQCAPFKLVDKSGKEDTEAKKLLEKPWYIDLVRLIAMGTYQGTTLIEMIELNDRGELKEVAEIPQSNFIASKGIIIKEEWDDKGVIYKEGAYKNYYVQIGNDYNLGLFSIMATIVIAKKLGLGSWMSFIEKFGVPPIFAITDRMDPARRDELFEMLRDYRMNHFGVLQGNEKIEVPNYDMNAYPSFDSLLKKCDEYISKYILGGTGITDQKSFVGSVEAQERLLKYRIQVDKLVFKYYLNEEIIPRLIKLSSVYKPLENLTFEYDESETLTLKEILDAIVKMSTDYEFDVDELVKRTGLPITGIKKLLGTPLPNNPEPQKKKTKPNTSAVLRYAPVSDYGIYARTWEDAIEKLTEKIWEEGVKASDLDKDLVLKYYNSLNESARTGWGKGYYTENLTRDFRENLLRFSGAKSYSLIRQLEELKKEAGSKEDYLHSSKKLINLHNETYQNVENKFASNSASSARDFNEYVKDADIYPNLMNRTMQDSDVRDSHAINEGVIKPVNEWTQIPPYDPGCRCWLEQTTEPPTSNGLQNIDNKWANNPALNGKIFVDENNYFTRISLLDKHAVKENTDAMKEYMPYNRIEKVGDNSIFINDFADLKDLKNNLTAAKIVSKELNKDIYIRPHMDVVQGKSNPELGIGTPNHLADLKTMQPDSKNFFKSRITSANKQGCKEVVLNIDNYKGDATIMAEKIKEGFYNKYKKDKPMNLNIERIIVIREKKVVKFTRKQIEKDMFDDLKLLN
jgi:hypothetical protein